MSQYFNQIIYGVKSFITGMRLTLNHFNKKKDLVATLQYPHEKWPVPERDIGFEHSDYNLIRSRLHVDIDDCIACMQCERACPVDCIKIDSIKPPKDNDFDCGITSNDTQKKMIVSRFTIDMSECMYCNLCVFPCPEECIYMVGGPNETKHEIDYEFSQYKRDGMIFEFADATDEMIKDAGGEKWIDQRDINLNKFKDGAALLGEVKVPDVAPVKEVVEPSIKKSEKKVVKKSSGELEIKSFNSIPDKMCRGILKKAYTASKRAGKDNIAILADVANALDSAGKMTDDIKCILDDLLPSAGSEKDLSDKMVDNSGSDSDNGKQTVNIEDLSLSDQNEIDLKDLNGIEDKMKRGTAKKAFLLAKKTGEDRLEAVRAALLKAEMMDSDIESFLNTFAQNPNDAEKSVKTDVVPKDSADRKDGDPIVLDDLPLFDIKELNEIDDKMARGMAKKIYTSGKRSKKSRVDIISDIMTALEEAGKVDEAVTQIFNRLRSGS